MYFKFVNSKRIFLAFRIFLRLVIVSIHNRPKELTKKFMPSFDWVFFKFLCNR